MLVVPELTPILAGDLAQRHRGLLQLRPQRVSAPGQLGGRQTLDARGQVLHDILDEGLDHVGALAEALHQHADLHDGGVRRDVAEDDVAELPLSAQRLEHGPVHDLAQHRQVQAVGDGGHAELVGHEGGRVRIPGDGVGDADLDGLLRLHDREVDFFDQVSAAAVAASIGLNAQEGGDGAGQLLGACAVDVAGDQHLDLRLVEDLGEELLVGLRVDLRGVLRRLKQLCTREAALDGDHLEGLHGMLVRL
mmetsp:Transcript_62523/g.158969  ORF Transcript_62523/g.158969 Transcript_62523/m.158969 type:complete len:249 (+) Transcript_62523:433-1179(+)